MGCGSSRGGEIADQRLAEGFAKRDGFQKIKALGTLPLAYQKGNLEAG
jgi:hypothetical protein